MENIERAEVTLEFGGPSGMAISADPTNGKFNSQGLLVFDKAGQRENEYKLGAGDIKQMLVHPQGGKLVLLGTSKFKVAMPASASRPKSAPVGRDVAELFRKRAISDIQTAYSPALRRWTLARPAKHPLLLLDVRRKDQQRWGRLMAFLFVWQFLISGPLEVATALITTRILEQFIGQIIGVMLLRHLQPERPRPYRMWLYPLPCAVALAGWLYMYLSAGALFIVLGLVTLLAGALVFLIWSWRARQ